MTWIETTDGSVFRLPDALFDWAKTTIAVVLTKANPFLSSVKFGLVGKPGYAEIL